MWAVARRFVGARPGGLSAVVGLNTSFAVEIGQCRLADYFMSFIFNLIGMHDASFN
jgi:acid phosphatase family membrane protein YuiD